LWEQEYATHIELDYGITMGAEIGEPHGKEKSSLEKDAGSIC
jgi:hypothetical protein